MNLQQAKHPTFYFIGVTTEQSSIMKLFPLWAKELGLDADIKGIDIDIHAPVEDYREVVQFIKNDEHSLGALITTHKIDLYQAAGDLFDELDVYAKSFGELSCISKRSGELIGHAKDHISSGLSMENFIPEDFWKEHGGDAFIIGAGGSSIAITSNLLEARYRPSTIYITNRSQQRLTSMKQIIEEIDKEAKIEYILAPEKIKNDEVLQQLQPYSLVVNATGLGKDQPGSPLAEGKDFPNHSLVWELNYRGDLLFMHQALEQREKKDLHVEDGWIYFIHGWTQVISEVFNLQLTDTQFESLEKIAIDFNASKNNSM